MATMTAALSAISIPFKAGHSSCIMFLDKSLNSHSAFQMLAYSGLVAKLGRGFTVYLEHLVHNEVNLNLIKVV